MKLGNFAQFVFIVIKKKLLVLPIIIYFDDFAIIANKKMC